MPEIHPTAIVDPQTTLADSVVIGPYCVVTGRVSIGENTRLIGNVYLQGPLTIGGGNTIYPFATIGFPPQDWKFDPAKEGAGTIIGNENQIREHVSIHRATGERPTTLGNRNYLMANSHIGHDSVVGNHCTLANSTMVAGHVHLFDNVMIGGGAGVHQFCRMGRMSFLSGNGGLGQDLPPFCISYEMRSTGSLNLVGLRRAGLRDSIKPLQRAFEIFFKENHTNTIALELMEKETGHDPCCQEMIAFIKESKRGITPYMKHEE